MLTILICVGVCEWGGFVCVCVRVYMCVRGVCVCTVHWTEESIDLPNEKGSISNVATTSSLTSASVYSSHA